MHRLNGQKDDGQPPTNLFDLDALASLIVERLRADKEKLIARPELADRLDVSERTVSTMLARGQLPEPLVCTGGITRWSWPDVLKFLAGRQGRRPRKGRGRHRRAAVEVEG